MINMKKNMKQLLKSIKLNKRSKSNETQPIQPKLSKKQAILQEEKAKNDAKWNRMWQMLNAMEVHANKG
jgi:hypothetical protein